MSWTLIEHQALTSSVASVTLGSGGTIPQTYKTLKVLVSGRMSAAFAQISVTANFNGSTANFSGRVLEGDGSGTFSYTATWTGVVPGSTMTSNTFGNFELTIPNYAGSTNKPYSLDAVIENNATLGYLNLIAGLWSNTSAITSIVMTNTGGGNWISGSTFTLYGLA